MHKATRRLDLGNSAQPLLAVICGDDQAEEPLFVFAQQYYKAQLKSSMKADFSTDVGARGWSSIGREEIQIGTHAFPTRASSAWGTGSDKGAVRTH